MTFQNPRPEIYDPKTLAVMNQAFAAIWNVSRYSACSIFGGTRRALIRD
jgi:hypothetical protein